LKSRAHVRNIDDYQFSPINAMTPEQVLNELKTEQEQQDE
jgi:hypothetical protein